MGKRTLWIVLGVVVLLALTASAALAAPLGQEEESTTDELWTTLAPLLAIATSVERLLEVLWERWEKRGLWPNTEGVASSSDPDYIAKKRLRSHWIGMAFAAVAIGLTNVRFFRLLGFDVLFENLLLFDAGIGGIFDQFTVGTAVDWVMTAGIIGWGGTELTHSIIEGLVKGRNLWKEMQEVQQGRKSLMDVRFFNDHIVPELEKRGVSVSSIREAFQTLESMNIPVNEFIASLTVGEADEFLSQLESQAEAEPQKARAAQAVRDLLEDVPPEKQVEIPNVLNLLSPDQRRQFLGA